MPDDLVNVNRESIKLAKAGKPSLLDLVLAQNLDMAMQIYKTEPMPGEVRVWQNSLKGERPSTVAWAFEQYFKSGKFPPKPADIVELVKSRQETDLKIYEQYHRETIAEMEETAKSRKEYFSSQEYKDFIARMKANHGI